MHLKSLVAIVALVFTVASPQAFALNDSPYFACFQALGKKRIANSSDEKPIILMNSEDRESALLFTPPQSVFMYKYHFDIGKKYSDSRVVKYLNSKGDMSAFDDVKAALNCGVLADCFVRGLQSPYNDNKVFYISALKEVYEARCAELKEIPDISKYENSSTMIQIKGTPLDERESTDYLTKGIVRLMWQLQRKYEKEVEAFKANPTKPMETDYAAIGKSLDACSSLTNTDLKKQLTLLKKLFASGGLDAIPSDVVIPGNAHKP